MCLRNSGRRKRKGQKKYGKQEQWRIPPADRSHIPSYRSERTWSRVDAAHARTHVHTLGQQPLFLWLGIFLGTPACPSSSAHCHTVPDPWNCFLSCCHPRSWRGDPSPHGRSPCTLLLLQWFSARCLEGQSPCSGVSPGSCWVPNIPSERHGRSVTEGLWERAVAGCRLCTWPGSLAVVIVLLVLISYTHSSEMPPFSYHGQAPSTRVESSSGLLSWECFSLSSSRSALAHWCFSVPSPIWRVLRNSDVVCYLTLLVGTIQW